MWNDPFAVFALALVALPCASGVLWFAYLFCGAYDEQRERQLRIYEPKSEVPEGIEYRKELFR